MKRYLLPSTTAARGLDQIGLDQPLESSVHAAALGGDGAQKLLVERGPEHRRFLQHAANLARQPVDARQQQPVQGRGDVQRVARRRAHPAISLAHQHATPQQPRTISSTNSGLPPARATTKSCSWLKALPAT